MDLTLDEFREIEQRRSLDDFDKLLAYVGEELGFEPPAPDPAPPAVVEPPPAVAITPADPVIEPTPPNPVDDPAHQDAVAAAQGAVADIQDISVPEAREQILADAKVDVEDALTQWPDSPELHDLKAKLDELEAEQP